MLADRAKRREFFCGMYQGVIVAVRLGMHAKQSAIDVRTAELPATQVIFG